MKVAVSKGDLWITASRVRLNEKHRAETEPVFTARDALPLLNRELLHAMCRRWDARPWAGRSARAAV